MSNPVKKSEYLPQFSESSSVIKRRQPINAKPIGFSTNEDSDFFKKRRMAAPSPEKEFSLPLPDFDAPFPGIVPDLSGFENKTHGELSRARSGFVSTSKQCPPTPMQRMRLDVRREYESMPFVKNALETRAIIGKKLEEKANLNKGQALTPFWLEVAPGVRETITDIEFLSDEGQFSNVYLCEVEGKGKWVIKVFKDPVLDNTPNRAITMAAYQLQRYNENSRHPVLKNHTAQHLNFDAHLEGTKGLLQIRDSDDCHEAFKKYVKRNVHQGFLFVKYVPDAFPVDFDKNDTRWQQLRTIFIEGREAGIVNDVRRTNMRVDGERVYNIDSCEVEEFSVDPKELRRSFTDKKEEQEWICPLLPKAELGKDG